MVTSCIAINCTNRAKKDSGIRFYRFPLKNKELLSRWLAAVKRDKWEPSVNDVLCSEHFDQSCFRFYSSQVRLRENAVPSIFSFTPHLPKKGKQRLKIFKHDICSVSGAEASVPTETSSTDIVVSDSVPQHDQHHDHNYTLLVSPCDVKRKYAEVLNRQKRIKLLALQKLKVARWQLVRRQVKMKMKSMNDIIRQLKSMGDVNGVAMELIEHCFGNIPVELMKRKLYRRSKEAYSDTLRSFAMTLHFYSAKAYNFVRNSFRCALPRPSSLRSWYRAVDGKPGFTTEAFECLRRRSYTSTKPLLCSLIFDDMSIRKHLGWNGKESEGYIDLGTQLDDDSLPLATEALLLLVVPLDAVWKIPIAYFLTNGLSVDVKANLVTEAISRLYEVNVRVTAIVCDGPSANVAVANKLGASLTAKNMNPRFQHPCEANWNVYIIFDVAQLLKFMQNVLEEKAILTDYEGKQIRCQYLKDLHALQDKEGLKAANKVGRAHVEWYQQKMNVRLAAHSFSRSVANALSFVSNDLKLAQFTGADGTIHFIRVIDRLFDALNSKNPFAKESKSFMRMDNEQFWRPFLNEASDYLLNLKFDGRFLHQSSRKTTVLGFVATITSVMCLFDELVATGSLQYLATHRLSKDHIELTFDLIRSRGQWNGDPTTGQFRSAYRQLLMSHGIKPRSTDSAVACDDLTILASTALAVARESVFSTDDILKSCRLKSQEGKSIEPSYAVILETTGISSFGTDIVTYLGGYVAKKLCNELSCAGCKSALLSKTKIVQNCILLERKNKGGLLHASDNVITVCTVSERCVRFIAGAAGNSLPRQRNMLLALQVAVIKRTSHLNLFCDDDENHSCNFEIFDSHRLNLIRLVVDSYVNICGYSVGRMFSEKRHAKNMRFSGNKHVLFAYQ